MRAFWHYTCPHGFVGVSADGVVKPNPATGLAWFTDMAVPDAEALGLTKITLTCDRTTHRFRVLRLTNLRRADEVLPGRLLRAMGGQPERWWVSERPVPVVLDEREVAP